LNLALLSDLLRPSRLVRLDVASRRFKHYYIRQRLPCRWSARISNPMVRRISGTNRPAGIDLLAGLCASMGAADYLAGAAG
jgi:hypothetical protein